MKVTDEAKRFIKAKCGKRLAHAPTTCASSAILIASRRSVVPRSSFCADLVAPYWSQTNANENVMLVGKGPLRRIQTHTHCDDAPPPLPSSSADPSLGVLLCSPCPSVQVFLCNLVCEIISSKRSFTLKFVCERLIITAIWLAWLMPPSPFSQPPLLR